MDESMDLFPKFGFSHCFATVKKKIARKLAFHLRLTAGSAVEALFTWRSLKAAFATWRFRMPFEVVQARELLENWRAHLFPWIDALAESLWNLIK